jgi:sulfide dehydrogenase cytochrome subunit
MSAPSFHVATVTVRFGLLAVLGLVSVRGAKAEIVAPPPGAISCAGCHAAQPGIDTPVPRIAGRPAADIVAALANFRSGAQTGTIMNRIAKGFTPEESAAIAAWYAGQKETRP